MFQNTVKKRHRSRSPDDQSTEQYFVYESKRRVLWSNFKSNNETDDIVKTTSSDGKLKSLFTICLTFVAKHIEYVESFIEFPSQIGLLIFNECLNVGRFNFNEKNANSEQYALILFAQAYPEYFTTCVNLNSNPLLFSYLSTVLKYCSIKCLDLSNCDCSAINLNDILQSSLQSLEVLNLSKNNLDHEFIKKFTLSQRLNLLEYTQLRAIDLTENYKLEPSCVQLFSNYKNLNQILLSVDKLKEYKFPNRDKFRVCECKCDVDRFKFESDGWLKEVICVDTNMSHRKTNLATKDYNEFVNSIRNKAQASSSLSFYRKAETKSKTSENRYETKQFRVKCDRCFKVEFDQKEEEKQSSRKQSTTKKHIINLDDELLKMYS